MASIKDVAEAAGVSTATVSRVLTNSPHVRPEVRRRVMDAVQKLEYRPNLIARSLRAQHTTTIGLLVSDIRNPFFTDISRAVEDTAYEHGYSVFLCNTDEDPRKEAIYLNLMRDANVAGIIYSPTRKIADFMGIEKDLAVVAIDRSIPGLDVDTVLLDNVEAAYRLTSHLLENGYRRIAALCGEMSTTGRERRAGYEEALRTRDLAPSAELVRFLPAKIKAGREATLKMLALPDPPDALLATNSMLAAGALEAIRERRLVIPDDIALGTFDETSWASLVQPQITLIAQPTYEIGKMATELLMQRIADPDRPTRKVILKGQLLVRGSSAPRRLSSV
jgi:LacI family fructose operon transcriptional repressor